MAAMTCALQRASTTRAISLTPGSWVSGVRQLAGRRLTDDVLVRLERRTAKSPA